MSQRSSKDSQQQAFSEEIISNIYDVLKEFKTAEEQITLRFQENFSDLMRQFITAQQQIANLMKKAQNEAILLNNCQEYLNKKRQLFQGQIFGSQRFSQHQNENE